MYNTIIITIRNGNKIIYEKGQWDDYSYDGSFFSIKKKGINISMYNARYVFSIELK